MPTRHFDVIVLGRNVGALICAALLSRRELRVLVLGQGQQAPVYRVEGLPMMRRVFTLLSATSPSFRRCLADLAQTQNFRRMTRPLDPMFALLDGPIRFEVPPDVELFSREIAREFPEVAQSIAELYTEISSDNGLVDAAFERDAVWPPGTFFERWETGRVASSLPHATSYGAEPLLEKLPPGHGFRAVMERSAVFSSNAGLDVSSMSTLALSRLHGSWTRGVHSLPRGEQELEEFLTGRILAHGGMVHLEGRAERLVVKRGRVAGVIERGEDGLTAAEAIVSATTGEALAELSEGQGISPKARDHWPRVDIVGGRFVVNILVDSRVVPSPLPRESFLVGQGPAAVNVHLQHHPAKGFQSAAVDAERLEGLTLLVAEMLLPVSGGVHLLGAREAVVATVREYLPFLDEHLVLIDSPHDGLPATSFSPTERGRREPRFIERIHLRGASPSAEAMEPRLIVDAPGYLTFCGEPIRGPITGSYLVGPSVLPALGQEGEVLAAWSVARILTRKDRARQRMRRQLWTKIETS